MIIESARIQMVSQHDFKQTREKTESLRIIVTPPRTQTATDQVNLSSKSQPIKTETQELDLNAPVSINDTLKAQIIKHLFKEITGKEMKLFSGDELKSDIDEIEAEIEAPPPERQRSEVGFIYQKTSTFYETEKLAFSALGTINTADGKTIDFSVTLNMSREFYSESNLTIRSGAAAKKVDPLVINFSGNAAELNSTKFEFDLDADGKTEQIATLKSGSGFLALDKNKDGKINDGSELFGPQSGNGFTELARYDDDNNGFIDEADGIYDSLRIWQHLPDGSQQLLALGDKDIGAIYLGHISTPFQLRTTGNESLGEVASTGIYIAESGSVGTVQHINLTV